MHLKNSSTGPLDFSQCSVHVSDNSEEGEMLKMSNHFSREAKLMLVLPVLLITIGFLVAIVSPWFKEHAEVDRCLDAGGRYDHETNNCIRSELSRESREAAKSR